MLVSLVCLRRSVCCDTWNLLPWGVVYAAWLPLQLLQSSLVWLIVPWTTYLGPHLSWWWVQDAGSVPLKGGQSEPLLHSAQTVVPRTMTICVISLPSSTVENLLWVRWCLLPISHQSPYSCCLLNDDNHGWIRACWRDESAPQNFHVCFCVGIAPQ